jgi:hypothetical protein
MVMVLTRIDEIYRREGFMIEVTRSGRPVLNRKNGVLKGYTYGRKLKDSATVNDWIRDRFEQTYPGYSCRVLKGDGSYVAGQTLLGTVCSTY